MPSPNEQTVSGCAKLVAITIPVTGTPATIRSLVATVLTAAAAAAPAGIECMGVEIEQQAAAFNWGDTSANCLGLANATDRWKPPIGGDILDHYVKSTTAGTVAAVAVVYFDRKF